MMMLRKGGSSWPQVVRNHHNNTEKGCLGGFCTIFLGRGRYGTRSTMYVGQLLDDSEQSALGIGSSNVPAPSKNLRLYKIGNQVAGCKEVYTNEAQIREVP
jgi:hypothetical protein